MDKKTIRQQFKEKRRQFPAEQLEEWALAIFDRAVSTFELNEKKISVFLPIERFHEINTWHFIEKLKSSFCLPVIKGGNELSHIIYEDRKQIELSNWGIPEPVYGNEEQVTEIDVVLVPLLAVDQKGYRVGYGKGFYDRFLKSCNEQCIFLGLSYFAPIEEITDIHENDIPLHACITPDKVFRF